LGGPAEILGGPAEILGGPAEILGGPAEKLGGPAEISRTSRIGEPAEILGGPAEIFGGPAEILQKYLKFTFLQTSPRFAIHCRLDYVLVSFVHGISFAALTGVCRLGFIQYH
jgi:hypothetical protein